MTARVGWSLIVPSRDGADTLPDCLAALARLAAPASGLEIILVDNASTDATAKLMRDFAAAAGAVVLSEPRPGKSHALNTGIAAARGDMLVCLDDDIVADAGLLEAYAAAATQHPDAGVIAGQLRPLWRTPPPEWIANLAEEGFSCGCTPANLVAGWISLQHVRGGNICFRRAAIGAARFATTDVNFGAGSRRTGGEDSEFARRVSAGRIRYVPDAGAMHIIAPHEVTWRSAFARYLRIGRGKAAQGSSPGVPALLGYGVSRLGLAALALMVGARTTAARYGLRAAIRFGSLSYRLNQRN